MDTRICIKIILTSKITEKSVRTRYFSNNLLKHIIISPLFIIIKNINN